MKLLLIPGIARIVCLVLKEPFPGLGRLIGCGYSDVAAVQTLESSSMFTAGIMLITFLEKKSNESCVSC